MLLGFLAFESSLKITNLIVVPRLSLCAFSSSLQGKSRGIRAEISFQLCSDFSLKYLTQKVKMVGQHLHSATTKDY